jgi:hypothetical protein
MTKYVFIFALLGVSAQLHAVEVRWPQKGTKITCGVTVDDKSLAIKEVLPNELLKAEADDGRVLVYIDLHKEGQVHWALNEAANDADYEKREAILSRLAPEDAALIKALSHSRQYDMYTGLTDGLVHLRQDFGDKNISLSCQEIPLAPLE